jgi:hypothetical protein
MNEYSGTEIIVAFRDNPSSLETQKKNLVTILHRVIRWEINAVMAPN